MHLQSHTCKMGSMLILVLLYFFVELIVGHILKSVTLVADSFHMLSDFIALGIGILARRIGKWPKSSRNTFGWQRAEVVGTLTNTVMLTTLTFTILIKSIQRFIEVETIKNPKLLLYVGLGGLLVNIIGLIILRGDHGHSHGPTEVEVNLEEPLIDDEGERQPQENETTVADISNNNRGDHGHNQGHGHSHRGKNNGSHMNLRAVFLHVLADFMGSVAVVTSALVLWLVPSEKGKGAWKNYIDPSISLLMVGLILASTIPLLKRSALILLQSVPKDVSIQDLKIQMENIDGIDRVHDLHVWLLQSDVIIGTVHIKCSKENYVEASKRVKELFHRKKIHCTTIQAEFEEHVNGGGAGGLNDGGTLGDRDKPDNCVLNCSPQEDSCNAGKSCCPTKPMQQSSGADKRDQPLQVVVYSAPSPLPESGAGPAVSISVADDDDTSDPTHTKEALLPGLHDDEGDQQHQQQ